MFIGPTKDQNKIETTSDISTEEGIDEIIENLEAITENDLNGSTNLDHKNENSVTICHNLALLPNDETLDETLENLEVIRDENDERQTNPEPDLPIQNSAEGKNKTPQNSLLFTCMDLKVSLLLV